MRNYSLYDQENYCGLDMNSGNAFCVDLTFALECLTAAVNFLSKLSVFTAASAI